MIVQKGNAHVHDYKKQAKKKVLLNAGKQPAMDILLVNICECGEQQAVDILERKI